MALLPPAGNALREVRAVYRQADEAYARFRCPESGECCQLSRTGREPWLWRTEWALLREELATQGRSLPGPRADGGCPFLDPAGKRCTVYAARPFGCRTYFCARVTGPPREPAERVNQLLLRLEAVTRNTAGEDEVPRPLTAWLSGG